MRAGLVAIFFFAAILALGHYVAAPFFCRGGIAIPTLDPRALCGADMHLSRSGSVLLYFASIAAALFFGIIAAGLSSRGKKTAQEKSGEKPVETFEQIVADKEKKQDEQKPKAAAPAPAAHPSAAAKPAATPAKALPSPAATPAPVDTKTPVPATPSAAETKPATPPGAEAKGTPAPEPEKKPEATASAETKKAEDNPLLNAVSEAITVGLAANKNGSRKTFDGTNEELLERFRELKKQEGVNSIAQAQRLLDESTLSALARGIDPKQHLSQVAHLVLAEDPDLKSGVVRGVVVHVAARLKELGVVNQKFPTQPTKGAA